MRPIRILLSSLLIAGCLPLPGAAQTASSGGEGEASLAELFAVYAQQIDLDDATRSKASAIIRESTRRGADLRAQLQRADREMQALLQVDSPDTQAVLAKADQVGMLRLMVEKNRLRGLLEIRALLSPEQRKRLARLFQSQSPELKREARESACRADLERLCPGAAGGLVIRCLGEHWDDLSPACRAQFEGSGPSASAPEGN